MQRPEALCFAAAYGGALISGGAGAQQHYSTLLRLKQYFPFSLIDAMGSLDECKAQIARELRYQSSLDLDESTCAACCLAIPSCACMEWACNHWQRMLEQKPCVINHYSATHAIVSHFPFGGRACS